MPVHEAHFLHLVTEFSDLRQQAHFLGDVVQGGDEGPRLRRIGSGDRVQAPRGRGSDDE
jgi:hypothetical protein